jgi:hypothetical protein
MNKVLQISIHLLILIIMLKYALVENAMALDPSNCVAIVSSPESKNLDDVINFMVAEDTGLTRPQAMAYFEKLTQTILYFVGQGHSVATPLLRVRPTISGVLNNKSDNQQQTVKDPYRWRYGAIAVIVVAMGLFLLFVRMRR